MSELNHNSSFSSAAKHVVEGVLATGLVILAPGVANAQSAVHPNGNPNDIVIMMNGQPKSGTISDDKGQMTFLVTGSGTHVLQADGQRVQLGSNQEKSAIARVNAALAKFTSGAPSSVSTAPTQVAMANAPAPTAAASIPTSTSAVGVEFGAAGHVTVHRDTSTVDLSGGTATVTFANSASIPFEMTYKHDGIGGGLLRSASRGGRSFATEGWSFSMAGREMFDSRNNMNGVPGGNDGVVMKAARELLAAMDDAKAQATKDGQSYAPVGYKALQDMVGAHSGNGIGLSLR